MGYTTEFDGVVRLDKALTIPQFMYLNAFSNTRRMKRDSVKAEKMPDKVRVAVGLPVGVEGAYFVGGLGAFGQDRDASVLNSNGPPKGQPGLWCQWVPTPDGTGLEWNGAEKFYDYVEWMQYVIENFLKPWGIVANGIIRWHGEERGDIGSIVVENNVVKKLPNVLLNDDAKTGVERDYSVRELFALLEAVEGTVSVSGGVLSFADGQTVDLKKVLHDE